MKTRPIAAAIREAVGERRGHSKMEREWYKGTKQPTKRRAAKGSKRIVPKHLRKWLAVMLIHITRKTTHQNILDDEKGRRQAKS